MTNQTFYQTTTMCPVCETLVPGAVEAIDDSVFITRTCPEHGHFKGLVCSDLEWYLNLKDFDVPPVKPAYARQSSDQGCPRDCGLCTSHKQKAGTLAIEVSNHCNLTCPTCLADNKGTFNLSVDEIVNSVTHLLEHQDRIDVLTLSGGEPTIHPQLFEILDALESMKIGRIVINSNGKRIAEDDSFLDELAKHPKTYVCLHFDGELSQKIRGVDHSMQKKALDRLAFWNINATPLVLAVKGLNEYSLGDIATNLLVKKQVKTVMFSVMAHIGNGKNVLDGYGHSERLTIPDVLTRIEENTEGRICKEDFMPLPMPNPLCVAIGYFLVEDERITPLISIAGKQRVAEFLANSHFGEPDEAFETFFKDVIYEIYSKKDAFENAESLLKSLRSLMMELFPTDSPPLSDDERRNIAEEKIKTVYIMQFMDSWTFDSVRMSKCSCQHVLPGKRIIPSCGYYCYHRKFDERFS